MVCRMSALHQAALSGNVDIMRLLLEHGAVVDVADSKSKSPDYNKQLLDFLGCYQFYLIQLF